MAELDDITAGYQALSANYVDEAGAIAGNTFRNLGNWRDDNIASFVEQVSVPLQGIKRNAASGAIAYHEQVARISDKAFSAPALANLDLSLEALRNGANANQVYGRPFVQMRMALAKGKSFTEALDVGSQTATSFARTEVQLSRRQASLFARRANDNIVGYLRTLSGSENCALCYVASTQRYRKGDLLPIHPACDCGEMPIYGDSDPGQVIDQQLLDKSHEAVGQRFGIDVGGRDPDYRKIMIRDHGEIGPMLTVKGQKFTGPNSLDLVGKKMPTPPPPPPPAERVAKIRDKADRIDGQQIRQDVLKEARTTNLDGGIIKTNRKSVSFIGSGPKANKYLDDVLDVGKDVDDELSRRVKDRIDSSGLTPVDVKAIDARKKVLQQQLDAKNAEIAGVKTKIQDDVLAQARAIPGISDDELLSFRYSADFNRLVNGRLEKQQPLIAKLNNEKALLQDEFFGLQNQLDDVIAPGSKAFDRIMADEATKLIEEIRGNASQFPRISGAKDAVELTEKALSIYPKQWVEALGRTFSRGITTKNVKRGYWLNPDDGTATLAISRRRARIKDQDDGFATAVHEVGHGMEDSVPGLKQMEYTYWQRRAKSDDNKIQGIMSPRSTREFGNRDEWREPYSGRSYGLGVDDNYEIFTTGVESLLTGSGYFGDSTTGQIVDDDFRRFVLGVLIGL